MEHLHPPSWGHIRILYVYPPSIGREAIVSFLNQRQDVEVVGEAGDAESALALAERLRPDIVICGMPPGVDPVNLAIRMARLAEAPRVLVMRTRFEESPFLDMLKSPIAGYLPAFISYETLMAALYCVREGLTVFGSEPRQYLLRLASHPGIRLNRSPIRGLTPREQEVLGCLTQGLANKEIAEQLGVGMRTVELHVSRILKTLGVKSRVEAAMVVMGDRMVPQ